jgi:hypothetical protein
VDPFPGPADLRRAGRNIHDGAPCAAIPRRHAPYGFAGAEHRTDYVHGENLSEHCARNCFDACKPACYTGVVDEAGERAQFAFGSLKEPEDFLFARNVSLDGRRGTT